MNVIQLQHTTSTGHRIPNHQGGSGKCARLHGHTYEFEVELSSNTLDHDTGMIADFGRIKAILDEWDHRTLLWASDPIRLVAIDEATFGLLRVPFIPTAEHMAEALAERFAAEFESVVFATVTVRESQTTSARASHDKHAIGATPIRKAASG